jgi:hypothetical protein
VVELLEYLRVLAMALDLVMVLQTQEEDLAELE